MNVISPIDIAWITGMLEGEGTFYVQNQRGGRYPYLDVQSIDREVVEHLQDVTGTGNIYTVKRNKPSGNTQTCYAWKVTNSRDVLHILCSVISFGFMSEHRTKQILEMVEACSVILNRLWVQRQCDCGNLLPMGSHYNRKYCDDCKGG